ncbi:MAG TPA: InlB B-repeat-containing protein [Methanocorpusculum sp.]|nr:InlB B-repeat-containing protein [Methanocorpusculum sp.]HJK33037.1 InlB B-repeat-containing protein [Methanocorpusculum sp.]HJK42635.1 InlB B-repeat-containing protein [Methanocorpusculum sp.]
MMKTRLNGTERPKKDAGGLRHGLLVLAVLLLTCVLMAGAVSASDEVTSVSDIDNLTKALEEDKTSIALAANIETNKEIVVDHAVTIDGNGYTISAGDAISKDAHLLEITKGPVTLKNLTLDSKGKAKGLNIHQPGQEITLTNLTLTNSAGSGITINGAEVSASNLTISESGWNQSIDVGISAKPSVYESTLTLSGTNNLLDIYQINSDKPDNVTVKGVDVYTIYDWYYWYMDGATFMPYDNYKRTWTTNSDFATEVDIPKVQGSKAAVWVYDTDSKVYALHQDIRNATTHFKAGDSVKQLQDIHVDAPITIEAPITFDGNGMTISGESDTGYFLMVAVPLKGNETESVTLQNLNLSIDSIGSSANLGGITVRANADNDESVPVTLKNSIVDMSKVTIESGMNPAVYFVNASNSQIINNNKITAGAASSSSTRCVVVDGGSGVIVSGNTLNLGSGTAVAVGVEIKGNDVDKVTVSGNTLNPGTSSDDAPRAVKITAKDTGSQKTFTVSKNDILFDGKGTTVEVLLSTYKISEEANAQVKLNVEENTGSTASVVMLNKGATGGEDILLASTITLTGNIYNPGLTSSSEEVAVVGGFAEGGSEKPNTDGVTHVNPAPQPVYSSGGNMNNAYRVLFNDGATTLSVQTDLSSGDKLTKPETPVKDGYTFAGWYKDSACTQPWDFETGISGDMTLYAKWTAAGSSGETEATATPTKTQTAVTTPQPTKTQTAAATTSAPEATTAAGVSPTLTQAPAPVAGALFGLLAAGVLLRRRFQ